VTTSPYVTDKTFLDAIYSGGDPLPPGESLKKNSLIKPRLPADPANAWVAKCGEDIF
jgi:hypothetical protein